MAVYTFQNISWQNILFREVFEEICQIDISHRVLIAP